MSVATEANDHGMDCGRGPAQNLTIASQAKLPHHRHRQHRGAGLHSLPGDDQRPAHRHHRGHPDHRPQPDQHVDGLVHPTGRRLGHRPDRAGAGGPAGTAHRGHRRRLRALGHRDAGLPEPAAGAAGATTRQGRSRHRDRLRYPRPAGRRLPRRGLRRLRPGQPRLLRRRRARDRQRHTARHREGRHITGAAFRPATILDGVPQPLTGTPAATALQSWTAARSCTDLSADASDQPHDDAWRDRALRGTAATPTTTTTAHSTTADQHHVRPGSTGSTASTGRRPPRQPTTTTTPAPPTTTAPTDNAG